MESMRRQLEGDDPNLTKLSIGDPSQTKWGGGFAPPSYLPHGSDWMRDGRSVGSNMHIRVLYFSGRLLDNYLVTKEELESFCGGLSHNNSIERLGVYCSTLSDWEILTMLSPFFERNSNLRSLVVHCDPDAPNGVQLLSEVLSRFAILKEFECNVNLFSGRISGRNVNTLVQALAGHPGLNKIDFSMIEVGEGVIAALVALVNHPNSSLVDLRLHEADLDDDRTIALAACLTNAVALKKLNLTFNPRITVAGWSAIFTMLQNAHSSLEDLVLCQNSINDDVANLLATLLSNGTHLKRLDVSGNYTVTPDGWHSIFDALQSHQCILEELLLCNCGLNDESVADLANLLSRNNVLKHLQIRYNLEVTPSGWRVFSAAFLNRNSALEAVDLEGNSIDDDVLIQYANSLVGNNKLKKLLVDPGAAIMRWDVFENLMCSGSSILGTFQSNHTLGSMSSWNDSYSNLPPVLSTLLRINRENLPRKAARRKIIKVHFSGVFDMQPFVGMNLKVLPRAIAWMAEDEHGASLLYQFARRSSIFVDVGKATRCENDSRSKRQRA